MKNLFLFLTVMTFTFQSCSSDDDSNDIDNEPQTADNSQYAGTWSGTYDGDDTGTWSFVISEAGNFVSGRSHSNNGNVSNYSNVTITASGQVYSLSGDGSTGVAQITGEYLTGTWEHSNLNISGAINGSRE